MAAGLSAKVSPYDLLSVHLTKCSYVPCFNLISVVTEACILFTMETVGHLISCTFHIGEGKGICAASQGPSAEDVSPWDWRSCGC